MRHLSDGAGYLRHQPGKREFFIDNLLVLILFMIWWTGLAPWDFEFFVLGSLISAFLAGNPL